MTYTIDRRLPGTGIDEAEMRIRAALQDKGFGVLTEIDVKATMKKKLDRDMPGYRILGACNPQMAWQALALASMPRASASAMETSRSGACRPSWANDTTSAGPSATREGGRTAWISTCAMTGSAPWPAC